MATLKQRMWRKNNAGTYDTIHLETESSLVLRPSGRTVEQDLTDFLPEVQATDDVPETLHFGRLHTNNKRPYIGLSGDVPEGLVVQSDKPLCYDTVGDLPPFEDPKDATTLGGHPASDFVLDSELETELEKKADADHTHTAEKITGGTLGGKVNANVEASAEVGTAQVRDIYAGTSDIGVGAALATGVIYLVYE